MSEYQPQRVVLRNGEIVLIREIGPEDRRLMTAGFEKLSDQSRFFRFLAPHKGLSKAELDRFTATNTDAHFAIGAASLGVDQDMPVGTARFVRRTDMPTDAEFALTIIDSHQRLGLGGLLLRTLARVAHARGIDAFIALMHRDNIGMQKLLACAGAYRLNNATEAEWRLPLPLAFKPTLSRQPTEIIIPANAQRKPPM